MHLEADLKGVDVAKTNLMTHQNLVKHLQSSIFFLWRTAEPRGKAGGFLGKPTETTGGRAKTTGGSANSPPPGAVAAGDPPARAVPGRGARAQSAPGRCLELWDLKT